MLLILIGKNVYAFPLPGSNMAPSSRAGIILWIRVGNLAALIKRLEDSNDKNEILSKHLSVTPVGNGST